MKTMHGLDFWTRSAVWLELVIPGYFFGKTFGTSDAKYRVLDQYMYPEAFIKLTGFFRDLLPHDYYYTSRFLGVLSGAMIGIVWALLLGLVYKWVMKDWSYAKAARIGSLAFILIALLTGFMADFFSENIGIALRMQHKPADEQIGRVLMEDYGGFTKGTKITQENVAMIAAHDPVKTNNPEGARGWWYGSIAFMYSWFILYFVCSWKLFARNRVPRKYWVKLFWTNFVFLLIYLRMGFGISASEFHYIVSRAPYLFGGH